MPPLTPYSECLERVRSVLVFFGAAGESNGAVLAELESEVRATLSAARVAVLPLVDVKRDLHRLAHVTLVGQAATSASRMMQRWLDLALERRLVDDISLGPDASP